MSDGASRPCCAISASVRVRSTSVARPSAAERSSSVNVCAGCSVHGSDDDGGDGDGDSGGEYAGVFGARMRSAGAAPGGK